MKKAAIQIWLALLLLVAGRMAAADCIPFQEAPKHVGDTACVQGKVLKVNHSKSGTWFLNFCKDYRGCEFTAVVFARNLRDVGDVRELEGKQIEIHGHIQSYHDQTEIILRDVSQLRGEAAKIPPVPKDFDVKRRGRFSAGSIRPGSSSSSHNQSSSRNAPRDPPDE